MTDFTTPRTAIAVEGLERAFGEVLAVRGGAPGGGPGGL